MAEEEEVAKPLPLQQRPLDPLGIAELQAYIAELKGEIARCEAAIARKQDHRGAADKFFRL